jgi:hypothetical protein
MGGKGGSLVGLVGTEEGRRGEDCMGFDDCKV